MNVSWGNGLSSGAILWSRTGACFFGSWAVGDFRSVVEVEQRSVGKRRTTECREARVPFVGDGGDYRGSCTSALVAGRGMTKS